MNVSELKAKLEKHQAYYDTKKEQLNQLDTTSHKWLHRYSRLLDLSNLITALLIKLNTEMMIAAFTDDVETSTDLEGNNVELVYNHIDGTVEVLTTLISNRTVSIEEILEITGFDLEEWSNGGDYDYNALAIRI